MLPRLKIAAPFHGAVLILGVCATILIPPLYKESLVAWLQFSKLEASCFFATLDGFAFFTLLAGMVIDRFGFTIAAITAAILTFTGYALLYVAVAIPREAPGCLAFVAAAICGQGSIFAVMVSLKVVAATVEMEDRGKAIGLGMTLFGLSGGFYTAIFHFCFNGDTRHSVFLCFGGSMSALMLISSLLFWPTDIGPKTPKVDRHSGSMNLILVYCITSTALVCLLSFTTGWALRVVAGLLVGSLLICALLALGSGLVLCCSTPHVKLADGRRNRSSVTLERVELGVAVKEYRYWFLWCQFACLVGAGMSMINLLANLVVSAEHFSAAQKQLKTGGVAWFSVGNVISRFILGYMSDMLLAMLARTSFMTMASGLMVFAMVLVREVDAASQLIFLPCFLAGFAFGMPWILVPAIEIDWYGHEHFTAIHGVMMLAAVSGVLVLFNGLSIMTEDSSKRNPYVLMWLILAGLNALGFFGGILGRTQKAQAGSQPLMHLQERVSNEE